MEKSETTERDERGGSSGAAPCSATAPEILANAYWRLKALTESHIGELPPDSKPGWDHSEMVLVYYAADPEMDRLAKWSIAYFHHKPPFEQKPHWVDFNTSRGAPDYWWPLPDLPNDQAQRPPR